MAGRILRVPLEKLRKEALPHSLEYKEASKFPTCLVKVNKNQQMSIKSTKFTRRLANMNDGGSTFKQIAAYIRKKTIELPHN